MLYKGLHLEIQIVWEYYCTYGTHSRQEYSMLVKIIFFSVGVKTKPVRFEFNETKNMQKLNIHYHFWQANKYS